MKQNPSPSQASCSTQNSSFFLRRLKRGLLAGFFLLGLAPVAAEANNIFVNTPKQCNEAAAAPVNCALLTPAVGDGDGLCSLGEAIMAANTDAPFGGCTAGNGSDVIMLSDFGPYNFTKVDNVDVEACTGPNALPTIEGILRIDGARDLVRSSTDFFRLAHLYRGITTFTNTTIKGFNPGCDPVHCGNGKLDPGEECDEGDTSSGDGCSATCQHENCGDGVLDPGEQCESISFLCSQTFEDCTTTKKCPDARQCLDANGQPLGFGGACTADEECTAIDGGVSCEDTPSLPQECLEVIVLGCNENCENLVNGGTSLCGNGLADSGEGCDTGGICVDSTGKPYEDDVSGAPIPCTSDFFCQSPDTGPGHFGDYCAAQDGDDDGCTSTCQLETCGDGDLDDLEECDPGSACSTSRRGCKDDSECDPGTCSATGASCQTNADCPSLEQAINVCERTDVCQPLQTGDCDSCRRKYCDQCYDGGAFLLGNENAEGPSPAILELHGATLISNATLTYPDPLTINRTDGVGGAIAATQVGENLPGLKITDTRLDFNESSAGGAVIALASNIEVANSTFNANVTQSDLSPETQPGGGGGGGISGIGGAMATVFSDVTIEQSAFLNNRSTSLGGAVMSFCSGYDIDNSSFFKNKSNDLGGGFAVVMDPLLCIAVVSGDGGGDGGKAPPPPTKGGSFDEQALVAYDAIDIVQTFDAAAATGHCSDDQSIECDPFAQEDICHSFRNAGNCEADTTNGGGDDGFLGGLFEDPTALLDFLANKNFNVRSSTIAFNYANLQGGGMYVLDGGTLLPDVGVSLMNTILADNRVQSPTDAPNCDGELVSGDHNLFGDLTGCIVPFKTNDFIGDPGFLGAGDFIACDATDTIAGRQYCEPSCEGDGLDRASLSSPGDDQLGTLRFPLDATADIGAIERNDCADCGNGIRELPYESCDDGGVCVYDDGFSRFILGTPCTTDFQCNPDGLSKSTFCEPKSGDGCSDECTLESCGNRVLDKDEECDDGQHCLVNGDSCTSVGDCPVDDNGNATACARRNGDGCNSACIEETCGDGITDQNGPDNFPPSDTANDTDDIDEECDDGNKVDNDACGNDCKGPVCGNGAIEAHEECEFDVNGKAKDIPDTCFCHPESCELECGGGPGGETQPFCNHDSVKQIGEECDDGLSGNTDNCTNECILNVCGDGFRDPDGPDGPSGANLTGDDEECDDNNQSDGDGCSDTCKVEPPQTLPTCGDGSVGLGEECDDGKTCKDGTTSCTVDEDCTPHDVCNDASSNAGTECTDDTECPGGLCASFLTEIGSCATISGDGCDAICQVEVCGDGTHNPDGRDDTPNTEDDEECEDNNNITGDGCSSTCKTEFCGDGLVSMIKGEECDNGGLCYGGDNEGNACNSNIDCPAYSGSATCDTGVTGLCIGGGPLDGESCSSDEQCKAANCLHNDTSDCQGCDDPQCGNGIKETGEECDDGVNNSSAQDKNCRPGCVLARCGDGIKDPNGVAVSTDDDEQCDDGNQSSGDGCSETCKTELPPPSCGDKKTDTADGEQCDDGNVNPYDDCTNFCTWATCGDNILHITDDPAYENGGENGPNDPEECDDGGRDDHHLCTSQCLSARCGDGHVQGVAGEKCDEGGKCVGGDNAGASCTTENQDTVCTDDGLCKPQSDDGDNCDQYCQPEGCGDGVKQGGEECDDGNQSDNDGCDDTCKLEDCGDSIVQPGEGCDDGGTCSTDGSQCDNADTCPDVGPSPCDKFCELNENEPCSGFGTADEANAHCLGLGYGLCLNWCVEDKGKGPGCNDPADCSIPVIATCDPQSGDGCDEQCQPEGCGDGVRDPDGPDGPLGANAPDDDEECDDGNQSNGDGCSDTCKSESCGDDIKQASEQCEDGNTVNGDGCNEFCQKESCGDSVLDLDGPDGPLGANTLDDNEECDDGNQADNDGCDDHCKLEDCGDGIKQPSEECDDGCLKGVTGLCEADKDDGDGCSHLCREERCGDGIKDADGKNGTPEGGVGGDDEQCDDGNQASEDGCSDACKREWCGDGIVMPSLGEECESTAGLPDPSFKCINCEIVDTSKCGDGQHDPGEECDDGDVNNNDECTNACTLPRCGDGVTQATEQCDDGNISDNDDCTNSCKFAQCGDGLKHTVDTGLGGDDALEACEDGNNANGDGCSESCEVEDNCPNNVVQVELGEECDDGNLVNDDLCSNACQRPYCGDGVETGGEECDDGNHNAHDLCTNDCIDNVCGDGILLSDFDGIFEEGEEHCDDGDGIFDDECNDDASAEKKACTPAECGDNVVQIEAGEECEPDLPGSIPAGQVCSNFCELEPEGGGGTVPFCGDGITNGTDQCDDGNNVNTDVCTNNCLNAFCGDGIVRTGVEECDGSFGCLPGCVQNVCGDGVVLTGVEQCDDNDTTSGDGCSATCITETPTTPTPPTTPTTPEGVEPICNNDVLETGEECDDGKENSDTKVDACRTDCRKAHCGDDVIDAGEECDGNREDCNTECVIDLCFAIKEDAKRVGTPGFTLINYLDKYDIDHFTGRSPNPDVNECQPLAALGGGSNDNDFGPVGDQSSGCTLMRDPSGHGTLSLLLALLIAFPGTLLAAVRSRRTVRVRAVKRSR